MKNKYYAPDISDIYIGYEMECKFPSSSISDSAENKWIKLIISSPDFTSICDKETDTYTLSNNSHRTKYLDSDDIISLGFEEVRIKLLQSYTNSSEKELVGVFIKDNLEINYNFNTNKAYIKDDRNDGAIYFYGLCKSKNELKTLLKLIQ